MQGSGKQIDWGSHFQAAELGQHRGTLPTFRLRGTTNTCSAGFQNCGDQCLAVCPCHFAFWMELFVTATLCLFTIVSLDFGEIICFFCLFVCFHFTVVAVALILWALNYRKLHSVCGEDIHKRLEIQLKDRLWMVDCKTSCNSLSILEFMSSAMWPSKFFQSTSGINFSTVSVWTGFFYLLWSIVYTKEILNELSA